MMMQKVVSTRRGRQVAVVAFACASLLIGVKGMEIEMTEMRNPMSNEASNPSGGLTAAVDLELCTWSWEEEYKWGTEKFRTWYEKDTGKKFGSDPISIEIEKETVSSYLSNKYFLEVMRTTDNVLGCEVDHDAGLAQSFQRAKVIIQKHLDRNISYVSTHPETTAVVYKEHREALKKASSCGKLRDSVKAHYRKRQDDRFLAGLIAQSSAQQVAGDVRRIVPKKVDGKTVNIEQEPIENGLIDMIADFVDDNAKAVRKDCKGKAIQERLAQAMSPKK